MNTLTRLFLAAVMSLFATGLVAAQNAPMAPTVGALKPGTKKIEITLAEKPGDKPVKIEIHKNGSEVLPDETKLDRTAGKVTATLAQGLANGDKVKAKAEVAGKASPFSAEIVVADPDANKPREVELQITSIGAIAGSKKVTVFFKPLPSEVEKATLLVQAVGQLKTKSISEDERKAGSAEVELSHPLAPAGDGDDPVKAQPGCPVVGIGRDNIVTVTLTAAGKNVSTKPKAGICSTARIHVPKLTILPQSVKEGEDHVEISGAKEGTILVRVYRGVLDDSAKKSPQIENARDQYEKTYKVGRYAPKPPNTPKTPPDRQDLDRLTLRRIETLTEIQRITHAAGANTDLVKLVNRLNSGEWVMACILVDSVVGEILVAESCSEPRQASSVLLDWGRVRGVFSLGTAIDTDGEQSAYLDFMVNSRVFGSLLDKNYYCPEKPDTKKGEHECTEGELPAPGIVMKDFRADGHTFFNARLTNFGAANPTGTDATQPPTTQPDPGDRKITSTPLNTALVQYGFYGAFSGKGMDWIHQGSQYSFFIGPMAKFGVQTVSDGVITQRDIVTTKTLTQIAPAGANINTCVGADGEPTCTESTSSATKSTDVASTGVQPFWAVGTRLGFFKYDLMGKGYRNRQVSSDLVSYLDISWGKFNAYRTYSEPIPIAGGTLGAPTTMVDATTGVATRMTPQELTADRISSSMNWRMNLEARMKIPYVPAFVGFDANFRATNGDQVPNDLRFLVGFRVDANKVLGVFNKQATDK